MIKSEKEKELPSEKMQKLYEVNPSYILESIRKEKKNDIKQHSKIKIENIPIKSYKNKEQLNSRKKFYSQEKSNLNPFIKGFSLDDVNSIEKKHRFKPLNNSFSGNYKFNKLSLNYIQKITNSNNPNNINDLKCKYALDDSPKNNNNKIINIKNNNITTKNSNNDHSLNNKFNFIKYNNNNIFNENKKEDIFSMINNIDILLLKLKSYWGSIYLQSHIYYLDNSQIMILLITILPYLKDIMCLEYGNYFFQKFIQRLNVQQKLKIYQIIEPNFLYIALNKIGTHSIQSLIEVSKTPIERLALYNLLNKDMLLLFNDKYAFHIIMKIIMEVPENQRNNINVFLVNNIEKISINPYGSYCVNKYIVNNNDLVMRIVFIKKVNCCIKEMFFHKCSCSILLLMLKHFGFNNCVFIFQEMQNNICNLINNPISSLFVLKLLLYLKNNNHLIILNSIIWNIYKNDATIKTLHSSPYGDKVLKQLLLYSNSQQKKYIKEKLNL